MRTKKTVKYEGVIFSLPEERMITFDVVFPNGYASRNHVIDQQAQGVIDYHRGQGYKVVVINNPTPYIIE